MQRSRFFLVSGFAVLFMWGAFSVSAQEDGQEYADPTTAAAPADGSKIPLDSSGRRLLLSLMAPSCPFSMPGVPETMVRAEAREAIDGALEPIVPEGTSELASDGLWTGHYCCRLTDARRVS